LCRDRVHVTDEDLKAAFDAYYGEKIDCRLVLFTTEKEALTQYADLRKGEESFNRVARTQANPTLAATGGQIGPIGHHTTGNDDLEKEAFSLHPGDVSRVIGTPDGFAVLWCNKRIPPDTSKKLEEVRPTLEKEIIEKKTHLEVTKVFQELKDQAQPKLFIKKYTTQEELEHDVKQELKSTGIPEVRGAPAPPVLKAPMK
jgi:parvulin-like peptidyl-prolyl isomerase